MWRCWGVGWDWVAVGTVGKARVLSGDFGRLCNTHTRTHTRMHTELWLVYKKRSLSWEMPYLDPRRWMETQCWCSKASTRQTVTTLSICVPNDSGFPPSSSSSSSSSSACEPRQWAFLLGYVWRNLAPSEISMLAVVWFLFVFLWWIFFFFFCFWF